MTKRMSPDNNNTQGTGPGKPGEKKIQKRVTLPRWQVDYLEDIHARFARSATDCLSGQEVRTSIKATPIKQCTYGEFLLSVPDNSTLGVINMDPLEGKALLTIGPSVTGRILDLLMGGSGARPLSSGGGLTHIELSVMMGAIVRLLGCLRKAWINVIDLRPRLATIGTDARRVELVQAGDMVLHANFKVKIMDTGGMINLCLPFATFEPIAEKLNTKEQFDAKVWADAQRKRPLIQISPLFQFEKEEPVRHIEAIKAASPEMVKELIDGEKPGIIALVLSCLDPTVSSEIVSGLELDVRVEVQMRMAEMKHILPEVLREVERMFERKLVDLND